MDQSDARRKEEDEDSRRNRTQNQITWKICFRVIFRIANEDLFLLLPSVFVFFFHRLIFAHRIGYTRWLNAWSMCLQKRTRIDSIRRLTVYLYMRFKVNEYYFDFGKQTFNIIGS